VYQAEIARVVAEDAGEEYDEESEDVTCLEGVDGQEEDETAQHAVDHTYDGHRGAELRVLVFRHELFLWYFNNN
jgi:hypothetical protein